MLPVIWNWGSATPFQSLSVVLDFKDWESEILQENPDLWNWLTGQAEVPSDLAANSVSETSKTCSTITVVVLHIIYAGCPLEDQGFMDSFDYIFRMGPNLLSQESVKNIACIGQQNK